VSCKAVVLTFG